MRSKNNIWKNIESIILDTVNHYSLKVNTIYKHKQAEINPESRDGTGKTINITADYLGAIKQVPVLLKGIYEVMPNIEVKIRANKDLQEEVNKSIIYNELSSSEFYITSDKLEKIRFITCNNASKADLELEFSVSPLSRIRNNIAYHTENKYCNNLFIWIDPLKFEPRKLLNNEEQEALRQKYGINKDDYVIMGGSVDTGEFFSLIHSINITKQSKTFENQKIQTIIVPRRNSDYINMEDSLKLVKPYTRNNWKEETILVNEKGVLADLYSIADVAFIGDTLDLGGNGQNPLEPAFYGKKIVSGRCFENNIEAFNGLYKSGLLIKVKNVDELAEELSKIPSKEELIVYQKSAKEFIESRQGAAKEYAKVIQKILYETTN